MSYGERVPRMAFVEVSADADAVRLLRYWFDRLYRREVSQVQVSIGVQVELDRIMAAEFHAAR